MISRDEYVKYYGGRFDRMKRNDKGMVMMQDASGCGTTATTRHPMRLRKTVQASRVVQARRRQPVAVPTKDCTAHRKGRFVRPFSMRLDQRCCYPIQRRALRNIRIHGESSPSCGRLPRHLHRAKHALRMWHRDLKRPSAVVSAQIPPGDPFGLNGYVSVTFRCEST